MPKPTRPPPGRNVPTPVPNRNDRANFAVRGDATMTALPGVVDDVNANVVYIDAALDYADEQVAAAEQAVVDAAEQVDLAAAQRDLAREEKEMAQEAAASAINAPGTSGTSATSMAVSAGSKVFTTQPGKAWVIGQPVVISRITAPTAVQMYGTIAAYNGSTGAMEVAVPVQGVVGSGTFGDWTIALTGRQGRAGVLPVVPISTNTVGVAGFCYHLMASCTLTAPPLGPDDEEFEFRDMSGTGTAAVDFGATKVTTITGIKTPGLMTLQPYTGRRLRSSANATTGYLG